ncbi:MAG: hypothetical protein Q8900_00535 [Bacillota bacterium]|nr:hypothetical protein [Bacillota bacterium]
MLIPRAYSDEDLKEADMLGEKIIIKSDLFSFSSYEYKNPYYKVSEITNGQFVKDNNNFICSQLMQLNICKTSTIKKLDVYQDKSLGFLVETFYFEDDSTIITNDNYYAFFELKKIK